jgi:hypothetical protein
VGTYQTAFSHTLKGENMKFKKYLQEDIKVPIKVGDYVLGGRFKNKKIKVKSIGKNDKGDILINNKPLMKYRIMDKQPEDEK